MARDAPREPVKVVHARKLIAQHLSNPDLNVRFLARWMACSPDYLSHCFRTATGITLTRYINSRRILQAQTLMQRPSMNIREIAHASGYRDAGYFARIFRQITSRTPKQHRQRLAAFSRRD